MKNKLIAYNDIKHLKVRTKVSLQNNKIEITVRIEDALSKYIFPTKSKQKRTHELWKATCFELFLANSEKESYYELNFSSSLAWNFYFLKHYRADVEEVKLGSQPKIEIYQNNNAFQIDFSLDLEEISLVAFDSYNVATILLTQENERTFWSVKHQQDAANFHHRSNFLKIT